MGANRMYPCLRDHEPRKGGPGLTRHENPARFPSAGADEPAATPHVLRPEHHATLFGIMVRNAIAIAGQEGLNAAAEGVKAYALQRGSRMRTRALANGDPLTFAAYMAYSEWAAPSGSIQIAAAQRSPTYITRTLACPWHAAWLERGMLEEGYCYCKYIDEYLVRGFNNQLVLGVNSVHTDGVSEYCEFVWNGLDFTPQAELELEAMRRRVQGDSIRSWEYHIAHLFAAMSAALTSLTGGDRGIITKSRDEFVAACGAAYGPHAARVLDAARHIDFTDPSGRL